MAMAHPLECRGKEPYEEVVAEVVPTAVEWLVVEAQVVAEQDRLPLPLAMERLTWAVEEEDEPAVETEAMAGLAS